MNYNVISYLIYLPVTFYITIKVGWTFYENGQHYIDTIIPDNLTLSHAVNRMLLIGYYLVNLGYVTMSLSIWQRIESIVDLFNFLSMRIAIIIIFLGILHFINMSVIWWYGNKHDNSFHPIKN